MSVLIKGMETPNNPDGTMLCVFPDGKVKCMDMETYEMTTKRAVPVPPHGRLIDADALMARFEKEEKAADEHGRDFSFSFKSAGENCAEWWSVQQMLFDAPTIIGAEEGE